MARKKKTKKARTFGEFLKDTWVNFRYWLTEYAVAAKGFSKKQGEEKVLAASNWVCFFGRLMKVAAVVLAVISFFIFLANGGWAVEGPYIQFKSLEHLNLSGIGFYFSIGLFILGILALAMLCAFIVIAFMQTKNQSKVLRVLFIIALAWAGYKLLTSIIPGAIMVAHGEWLDPLIITVIITFAPLIIILFITVSGNSDLVYVTFTGFRDCVISFGIIPAIVFIVENPYVIVDFLWILFIIFIAVLAFMILPGIFNVRNPEKKLKALGADLKHAEKMLKNAQIDLKRLSDQLAKAEKWGDNTTRLRKEYDAKVKEVQMWQKVVNEARQKQSYIRSVAPDVPSTTAGNGNIQWKNALSAGSLPLAEWHKLEKEYEDNRRTLRGNIRREKELANKVSANKRGEHRRLLASYESQLKQLEDEYIRLKQLPKT